MVESAATASLIDDKEARRNAVLLSVGQALGGSIAAIIMATGGHVGVRLAPDLSLATLPVTSFILGTAFSTLPANLAMRWLGRRGGYIFSCSVGTIAMLVAVCGIYLESFALFIFGTFATGVYWAFVQSYRFAATDVASEGFKNKAISWVLVGGILAAIVGPQTAIWTQDLIPDQLFLGTYMAAAVIIALSMPIVTRIRIDKPKIDPTIGDGRPLREIMGNARFLVAVLCGVISYSTMSFVMTASPIAMVGCGFSHSQATLGIQWHALAMYAPSFFTGHLITRFGKSRVVAAGMIILLATSAMAVSGITIAHFWIALVLLGIGWNFGYIGATAMVTDCYRPEERNKVQGVNDFLIFGMNAAASLSAGIIYFLYGWAVVASVILPGILICLAALAWMYSHERRMLSA